MYLLEDTEVVGWTGWREDRRGWGASGAHQRPADLVVAADDPDFPAQLRSIPDPPRSLWIRGAVRREDALAVAIVGSRRATSYGLALAERLAAWRARQTQAVLDDPSNAG